MKKFCVVILLVFTVLGCDSARNPFNAISGEAVVEESKIIEVNFSLPYGDNIVYPGGPPDAQMAPASLGKIYVESNLLAEASYPESQKLLFDSVQELNRSRIRVHTALPGWLRVWFKDGGTIYDVWVNGVQLNNMDKNGAFLLMFDTDGAVIQLETETQLVNVEFKLSTNESSSTTIYISSDVTGWAGVPMTYVGSTTWTYSGRFLPNKDFTFVAWSNTRARYIYGLKVNGTEVVYLVKVDEGTKTAYPVYHFKGKLDQRGTFLNAGPDNRQVIINQLDP